MINDVREINIKRINDDRGSLSIISEINLPYKIKRVFTISSKNIRRGNHAHKKCNQFLVCVQGSLKLTLDDSKVKKELSLDSNSGGILIPAGIWSYQDYLNETTTINVFCDHEYDESDYIRDYEEFLDYCSDRKT
ncbi:MAG: FdtA/QdtA family cupin domain-containing protein [Pseudomonadota bacterium]|nr:FdtA/QdtA family cupin domain-containing protein [Pseudomonadota bacterium]